MTMNLMMISVKKVFISSNSRIICLPCPLPSGRFLIQESAVGGLSYYTKKPSLVTARACVLIFQAFQLFSSSVQFCGRSKLPYPCRPESHKQNTCEPASASCNLCRSSLPCRQVRRVTNIYVLSFCVLLIFFPYSKQFCYFRFTC